MRTLAILTGDFPPTNVVGALRPFRLAKHIARAGWRVLILTHPPKDGHGLDGSLLEKLGPSCEILYVSRPEMANSQLLKFKRRVVGAARNYLQKIIRPDLDVIYVPAFYQIFKAASKKITVDVLLTTSPAHSIHLAGLLIKKKYSLPWAIDFRDPWDDYISSGVSRINNPVERWLEREVIHNGSAIISTTENYTEVLTGRHLNVAAKKFHTVTNTFDQEETLKNSEKPKNKFVICYTGIFYPGKDPYEFFRALRGWFDSMGSAEKINYRDKLEVQLIGSGEKITRQVIANLQLENNVVFFDRMPHEQAIEETRNADLALISTGLGEKTRIGWLPSKLFEYLGCRVPILALIREGEMAEIIRRTKSGHVINQDIHTKLGIFIKKCMDAKFYNGANEIPMKFEFAGVDRFEEKYVMQKFISIIEEIATPHV